MATGRCVSTINDVGCSFDSKLVFTKDNKMLITFSANDKLRAWLIPRKFPMNGFEFCRPQTLPELSAADRKAEKNILLAENYILEKKYRKAYQALRLAQEDVNYRFDTRVNRALQHLHEIGRKKQILNHRCLFTMMEEHKASVTALRFVDERNLVSGAGYGGLQHWDLSKGVCIGGLQGHRDAVRKIVSTDSGRIIATIDEKNRMRVWDLTGRQCTAFFDFSGHQDTFNHLTLNADGTLAFSVRGGKEGFLWNLEIGELEYQIDLPLEGKISQALFSTDGSSILVQYENRSWFQIDSKSGHFEKLKGLEPGEPDCPVDISSDSDRLSLNLRTSNGRDTVLLGHHHRILSHALLDNARMIVSGDAEGTIKLWELDWDLGF
jgi:WD40 repeat protein